MPEGHSIHRLARYFSEVFTDQPLRITSPQGRFSAGAARLDGRRARRAEAYGKHFFLVFDHELILNVHLGMYGAWTFGGDEHVATVSSIGAPRKIGEREQHAMQLSTNPADPPEPKPTTRVRIVSDHGWADLIGASVVRVLTVDEAGDVVASIGPDPLRRDADPQRFIDRALATRRPIGEVLMDQKIIGGIGNIYRAEGLFRTGINPHTPSRQLGAEQLHQLWEDEVRLMRRGVATGKIITTRAEDRPGIALNDAWPEHAYYVYQRQNEPCRVCGTQNIVVESMHQRKLYWCTRCQG